MKEIRLKVDRGEVLRQVAMQTAYAGAKKVGDEEAYERMATVDEDEELLVQLWDEARVNVADELGGIMSNEQMGDDGVYEVTLRVLDTFQEAKRGGMELGLKSYFVNAIKAQWYSDTSKEDSEECGAMAREQLDAVRRGAYVGCTTRRGGPF